MGSTIEISFPLPVAKPNTGAIRIQNYRRSLAYSYTRCIGAEVQTFQNLKFPLESYVKRMLEKNQVSKFT